MLTGASLLRQLALVYAPQWQRLPFADRRSSRPRERPHWATHLRTLMCTVGARRYWMAVLVRFTPQKSHLLSTMLKFVITTVEAARRHWPYRSKSALPG